MEVTTRTRKVKTVSHKRELRKPIPRKVLSTIKSEVAKNKGYGKGTELAENIGISWHELNATTKKGIAKPTTLEKIRLFFSI